MDMHYHWSNCLEQRIDKLWILRMYVSKKFGLNLTAFFATCLSLIAELSNTVREDREDKEQWEFLTGNMSSF